jgi:predicted nucleic acid-binding protein
MGRCVLDTSVIIALEKGHLTWESITSDYEDSSVPAIAVAEYLVGLHRTRNPRLREVITLTLETIESMSTLLDFGNREAKAFAILKAEAISSGIGRSDFDLAMAAHAVVEDAILVTRDKNARLSELTGVVTREV